MKQIYLSLLFFFAISLGKAQITFEYINFIDPICAMEANGMIDFQVSGGTAPYTADIYGMPPDMQQDDSTFSYHMMPAGSWELIVTDALGAEETTYVDLFDPAPITLSTSPTSPNCFDSCDGMIDVFVSGGIPPYYYSIDGWSTSQPSSAFVGLCAGVYTVSIYDANGCEMTQSVTLTDPQLLSTVLGAGPDCGNPNTGCQGWTNVLSVTGGSPPYAFNWDTGNTTQVVQGLCSGIYYLEIMDAAGCTVEDSIEVESSLDPIEISVDVTHSSCADGMAELTVTGGAEPLDISWFSGETSSFITNLNPGPYGVEVLDANGCYDSLMFDVQDLGSGFCSHINGTVYHDANDNCIADGDLVLEGMIIRADLEPVQPGVQPYYATTDAFGMYMFDIPYGTYTLTQTNNVNYGDHCNSGGISVTTNSSNMSSFNNDFLDSLTSYVNANVHIWASAIRPGFGTRHYVNVRNIGAGLASGVLQVVYPGSQLTYTTANPTPDNINGDTLSWDISNLGSNYQMVTIDGLASNVNLGDEVMICAEMITNETDIDPTDNLLCHTDIVTGSYDPNDKSVSPSGDITLEDNELDYLIRFQNTGTDTAFNIVVVDTISTLLNIGTFRLLGQSHDVEVEFVNENIVKFVFADIMLADSNINEPLSHGYVQFRIEQTSTNVIGDEIENTAAIYFDFNEPIITNTTSSLIQAPSAIESLNSLDVNVYPNPFTDQVTIVSGSNAIESVKIYNNLGQVIYSSTNNDKLITVNSSEWSKGIYMVELKSNDQVSIEKLVKQ